MKKVYVYPSDQYGCGAYRLIWPGEALEAQGKPVRVITKSPQIMVDAFNTVKDVSVGDADVVVFQRPANKQMQSAIPVLQAKGVRVVIDADDSLSKIHPRNRVFPMYDPRTSHNRNWMHAQKAYEMADVVTVTTEALAEEYGQSGNAVIVKNHVPSRYLEVPRPENDIPVVGWAGWTQNHPDDLVVTRGMINQVLVDTGAKFAAFGDVDIMGHLGIRKKNTHHELWNFTQLYDYPKTLVGFDIGIVPLANSAFNQGKSWLKGLEYASLGIIPIVSPIGDYPNLIDLGIAIPAATPKEWYDRTKELILDHEMRKELSIKVRGIASEWTIEGNTDKWWDIWTA